MSIYISCIPVIFYNRPKLQIPKFAPESRLRIRVPNSIIDLSVREFTLYSINKSIRITINTLIHMIPTYVMLSRFMVIYGICNIHIARFMAWSLFWQKYAKPSETLTDLWICRYSSNTVAINIACPQIYDTCTISLKLESLIPYPTQ